MMQEKGEWLVDVGGELERMTLDQLDAAFRAGCIGEETLVWTYGMPDWTRIGELGEVTAEQDEPTPLGAPGLGRMAAAQAATIEPGAVAAPSTPVDTRRRTGQAARDVEPVLELEPQASGSSSSRPRTKAPPPRRSRPHSPYQTLALESTAPVVRTLSAPVIPVQKLVPERSLRTWAAGLAAVLGLAAYGAAVMDLAAASSSAAARVAQTSAARNAAKTSRASASDWVAVAALPPAAPNPARALDVAHAVAPRAVAATKIEPTEPVVPPTAAAPKASKKKKKRATARRWKKKRSRSKWRARRARRAASR